MSPMKKKLLMTCLTALLLTACGEQHKAEGIIEKFLDANLVNSEYRTSYGKLGSTRKLDQHRLVQMQKASIGDKLFKHPIRYGAYKELGELRYLKTTIIHEKDTFVRTIYLHPELLEDGVMAVKEN